jgi:hypothetical protein
VHALGAGLVLAAQTRLRAAEIFAGGMIAFAGLAVPAAVSVPGSAFLFTWPVLAAVPPALGLALTGGFDRDTPGAVAAAIVASLPALFLVGPLVPQLFAAFGLPGAPALAGIAALLAVSAAPAARLVLAPAPRVAPIVAAAVAIGCYVAGHLHAPFDQGHPRPDTLFFAVDADAGRAFWMSPDPAPPPWARSVLEGATRGPAPLPFSFGSDAVLAAPAPAVAEPGPEIVWTSDQPRGAGRALRLRVVPPPGAEVLAVQILGAASARVEGRALPSVGTGLELRFYAPPAAGVEIEIAAPSPAPVEVRAVSQRGGFPAEARSPGPRPPEAMAKPGMMPPWDDLLESDMTIVARSSTR